MAPLTRSNHDRNNATTTKDKTGVGSNNAPSFAFSQGQISEALKDLIRSLGYDLLTITPPQKGVVAESLSRVVGVDPPWTWRYVHNVLGMKIDASQKFADAVLKMLAVVDGANPMMIRAKKVQVYSLNEVSPGALVLAPSKRCANPNCPLEFVPVVPRQRFCSAECRKASHNKGKGRGG